MDQLQPGTAWTLRNAKVDMYRGCMRLAVDQFGKLEPSENTSIEPKASDLEMQFPAPVICHVMSCGEHARVDDCCIGTCMHK